MRSAKLSTTPIMFRWAAATVFLIGAALYALTAGAAGWTFNMTPLFVGLVAISAGIASGTTRLIAVGLTLAGWGAAVLAVRNGPLPDNREAPAFLIGAALGLLTADWLTDRRGERLTGSIIAIVAGGAAFYAIYDFGVLDRWWIWTVALTGWAATEAFRNRGQASS